MVADKAYQGDVNSSKTNMITPIPSEFIAEMERQLGAEESSHLVSSLDDVPCCSIRFNTHKGGDRPEWVKGGTPVSWCEHAMTLPQRPEFILTPQWHAGQFYVQEAASTIISYLISGILASLPAAPRLLDLCAAPGGKSTAALDVLPADALVVANEYEPRRAAILAENIQRYGAPNVIVTRGDTEAIADMGMLYDIVIADVPCSGEGMMRKEEEARRQWTPGLVQSCARLQRQIADSAVHSLRPGGYMIYSTCTFNTTENEENVKWICSEYGLEADTPDITALAAVRGDKFGVHFYPHLTGTEGLFVALLRKPDDDTVRQPSLKQIHYKKVDINSVPWIDAQKFGQTFMADDAGIWSIGTEHLPVLSALYKVTDVLLPGTHIAISGKRGYEPTAMAALSQMLIADDFDIIDTDLTQARRFLSRRTDGFDTDARRGLYLVRHAGLPLGWMRNVGGRYNNLYPKQWHIRFAKD